MRRRLRFNIPGTAALLVAFNLSLPLPAFAHPESVVTGKGCEGQAGGISSSSAAAVVKPTSSSPSTFRDVPPQVRLLTLEEIEGSELRFSIPERYLARMRLVNSGNYPNGEGTTAYYDPRHQCLVFKPHYSNPNHLPDAFQPGIDDPKLGREKPQMGILLLHGSGARRSNGMTMAGVGNRMGPQGPYHKYANFFAAATESIDLPMSSGGSAADGSELLGGGATDEMVPPNLQALKAYLRSYIREFRARLGGLPIMIVTRSASGMLGLKVTQKGTPLEEATDRALAELAQEEDSGILGAVLSSPTLGGDQPIDAQRVAENTTKLYEVANDAEDGFIVHEPSLHYADKFLLSDTMVNADFAGKNLLIILGRRDPEVIKYERDFYYAQSDLHEGVSVVTLDGRHNVWDPSTTGRQAFKLLYDFGSRLLRNYYRSAEQRLQVLASERQARRDFVASIESRYAHIQARDLGDKYKTVSLSPRSSAPSALAEKQVFVFHGFGFSTSTAESVIAEMDVMSRMRPTWHVESINSPGASTAAAPDIEDFQSVDAMALYYGDLLRRRKAENPNAPILVKANGGSSVFVAAIEEFFPGLIDGIILESPPYPGEEATLRHAWGKVVKQAEKRDVSINERSLRWIIDLLHERKWDGNYFGRGFTGNFEQMQSEWTAYEETRGRKLTPVLIMTGSNDGYLNKAERGYYGTLGNKSHPTIVYRDFYLADHVILGGYDPATLRSETELPLPYLMALGFLDAASTGTRFSKYSLMQALKDPVQAEKEQQKKRSAAKDEAEKTKLTVSGTTAATVSAEQAAPVETPASTN